MRRRGNRPKRLYLAGAFIAFGGLLIMILAACQSRRLRDPDISSGLVSQLDALHYDYLTNNAAGAKQAMFKALKLLDLSTNELRIHDGYWFQYSRLFFIESVAGDSNVASIYFEKARYWYLIHKEDTEESPAAVARDLAAFSREQCKAWMLEWDRGITGGQGPRFYLESLAQQSGQSEKITNTTILKK